jgi:hypothetical protein
MSIIMTDWVKQDEVQQLLYGEEKMLGNVGLID